MAGSSCRPYLCRYRRIFCGVVGVNEIFRDHDDYSRMEYGTVNCVIEFVNEIVCVCVCVCVTRCIYSC